MEQYVGEVSKVVDLKRRYGSRISADVRGSDASEMTVIVANLMKEWNPIRSSVSDLKAIMGTPTEERSDVRHTEVLEYVFDNGLTGDLWRFTALDGEIFGVELQLLG